MKYKIKYKNKSYLVKAKDTQSALDGLSVVAPEMREYDDRLSPMTYKKLKELGYGHEQWKDLSQEEANKIVQKSESSEESSVVSEPENKTTGSSDLEKDVKNSVKSAIQEFDGKQNTYLTRLEKK